MGLFDFIKIKKNKSYFAYVGELPETTLKEINDTIMLVPQIYNIKSTDGKGIATEIYEIINNILLTDKLPEGCSDIIDVALDLAVYYAYAICIYYNWSWKILGITNENDSFLSIVSPNKYYSIQPLSYMSKILKKENIGLNGENDNTILLLFNMIETTCNIPEEYEYTPLS